MFLRLLVWFYSALDRRGSFPSMTIGSGARPWCAYPALSALLTMMGVERRWFLLSATISMAMWNAINSIVIGAATFCLLYGVGWWAWPPDIARQVI